MLRSNKAVSASRPPRAKRAACVRRAARDDPPGAGDAAAGGARLKKQCYAPWSTRRGTLDPAPSGRHDTKPAVDLRKRRKASQARQAARPPAAAPETAVSPFRVSVGAAETEMQLEMT